MQQTVSHLYPRGTIENELLKGKATFQSNSLHVSHYLAVNNVPKSAVRVRGKVCFWQV